MSIEFCFLLPNIESWMSILDSFGCLLRLMTIDIIDPTDSFGLYSSNWRVMMTNRRTQSFLNDFCFCFSFGRLHLWLTRMCLAFSCCHFGLNGCLCGQYIYVARPPPVNLSLAIIGNAWFSWSKYAVQLKKVYIWMASSMLKPIGKTNAPAANRQCQRS